jgi:hypothetical protein
VNPYESPIGQHTTYICVSDIYYFKTLEILVKNHKTLRRRRERNPRSRGKTPQNRPTEEEDFLQIDPKSALQPFTQALKSTETS